MKTTACVFASSLLLLVSNPVTWETRADEFSTVFQLRNSIAADDHLLSTHIADRHQWELRTTASDILGQSLVNGERLHFPGGSGMRGFIESSTERSDALRSTLYSTNANRQAVKTASFNLLPTISLVGELSRDTSRISASGFSGNLDRERASVEAQWVVYSGGANWARIRKSRHIAEASEWNYLAAERQIFLTNSGVYLEAVSAQKLVNAISDTVRRLKRIRYSTKLQYKAGFSSKTDIAQIDAEIASVSIQLEQARTTLEQQRIIYRDLVGREAPRKLADPKVSHLIPKTRQAAVDRALQSNYTINAAVSSHYAALENSNEAKGQLLPKVTLFANGSTRDNTVLNTSMRDYDWSAGIRVNIPLVNFSDRSRFHETRANAIAADYRQGIRTALSDGKWNRVGQRIIHCGVKTNC